MLRNVLKGFVRSFFEGWRGRPDFRFFRPNAKSTLYETKSKTRVEGDFRGKGEKPNIRPKAFFLRNADKSFSTGFGIVQVLCFQRNKGCGASYLYDSSRFYGLVTIRIFCAFEPNSVVTGQLIAKKLLNV